MRKSWIIRKDEKAVSPVIATILMVAITVVLAAVLYVMVTGLLSGPGPTRPQITVAQPEAVTNGFSFSIAGASQTKANSNYKVNFLDNTAASTVLPLAASMSFVVGGNTWTVAYTDVDGGVTLTPGDLFTATRTGGTVVGHAYHVLIFWSDGAQLVDAQYQA